MSLVLLLPGGRRGSACGPARRGARSLRRVRGVRRRCLHRRVGGARGCDAVARTAPRPVGLAHQPRLAEQTAHAPTPATRAQRLPPRQLLSLCAADRSPTRVASRPSCVRCRAARAAARAQRGCGRWRRRRRGQRQRRCGRVYRQQWCKGGLRQRGRRWGGGRRRWGGRWREGPAGWCGGGAAPSLPRVGGADRGRPCAGRGGRAVRGRLSLVGEGSAAAPQEAQHTLMSVSQSVLLTS